MLDASGSWGSADALAGSVLPHEDFSAPGLAAAAVWAAGLAIGVLALLTGHAAAAIVGLIVAVTGPWLGLAWVTRAQRGAFNVALPPQD